MNLLHFREKLFSSFCTHVSDDFLYGVAGMVFLKPFGHHNHVSFDTIIGGKVKPLKNEQIG